QNSTAWTVVFEHDVRFHFSPLNRFIYVKPVPDVAAVMPGVDEIRGKVSTVGIAAPPEKMKELALRFARWGATRICPLGRMQNPPLTWRHDGRPALGDLVTWTDFET
ncbi:MAG TPA: acyl-CoA reductase, partial [Verrucomicrobiae bacterium]